MPDISTYQSLSSAASGNYFENIIDKHKLAGLSAIRILIIDKDVHVAGMVKSILNRLHFKTIHSIRNSADALDVIYDHDIDLIISDWPMETPDGQDIVRMIRTQDSVRARTLPILLLTARGDKKTVFKARDAGITEFLIKPFSVQKLCARLVNIIENPRHFIISPDYIGPDRRRIDDKENSGAARRMNAEEIKANSYRQGKSTIISTPQGEVQLNDPDYSLRQRIGMSTNVRELLSEEVIEKAQEAIQENLGEVHEWLGVDLVWLKHNFSLMQKGVSFHMTRDNMVEILLSIKSKAGLFNFNIAAQACVSLMEYLEAIAQYQVKHDTVIKKHMDMIFVMFQKYIEGDETELDKSMITMLKQLRTHIPADS